jgi:catalase
LAIAPSSPHFKVESAKRSTTTAATRLAGEDPDHATTDLFCAIEKGECPAWRVAPTLRAVLPSDRAAAAVLAKAQDNTRVKILNHGHWTIRPGEHSLNK